MAQQHINQGTPPAGTDGDTNAAAWGKAEANFTELYGSAAANASAASAAQSSANAAQSTANAAQASIAILSKDYISGLKMVWVSGTALTVTSGVASRPSDGALLVAAADIAKTGLTLSASTWYHVYLFDNAGTPDVEIVTTAPASAYFGTARAKTGDTSRRYVGSLKTDGSGNVFNFIASAGGLIIYRVKTSATPFRALNNGKATTGTAVDLSSTVPATASVAYIIPTNQDSSLGVNITSSDSSEATAEVFFQSSGSTGMSRPPTLMHLNGSQQFLYSYPSAPTGGFFVDVWGYIFER